VQHAETTNSEEAQIWSEGYSNMKPLFIEVNPLPRETRTMNQNEMI